MLPLTAAIQLLTYGLNQQVKALPLPEVLKSLLTIGFAVRIAVLTVGVLNGALGYLRGKPLSYDCIGSMLPHAGKVICLELGMFLCVIVWMLPGMCGVLVGGVMIVLGQNAPVLGILGGVLTNAGMVVMFALAIYAGMGYNMGNCILIDNSSAGARNILKRSKAMMNGYRWHYFKVGLPVTLAVLVLVVLTGRLAVALPAWLNSLISTLLGVVTATFGHYVAPVMYEELRRIGR